MQQRKNVLTLIIAASGLLILIIDARGAATGALEGVNLCIKTIIPSLFPLFVISGYFCKVCSDMKLPFLRPILQLCGMPVGTESLLVIGVLGGYPVGAKAITDAWREGRIRLEDAKRLLGFCSNAGPAFIFGIIGGLFESQHIAWCLLAVLVLSAIITGWLLPRKECTQSLDAKRQRVSFTQIFEGSLKAIASVCGWVVLFRVLITFLKRWIYWFIPDDTQIVLTGVLELANGCIALGGVQNSGLRFMLSAGMLSFGGLCVYLQTVSVTGELGTGLYFPGKIVQCLISLIISAIAQLGLFPAGQRVQLHEIMIPSFVMCLMVAAVKFYYSKKTVAISQFLMYNTENQV